MQNFTFKSLVLVALLVWAIWAGMFLAVRFLGADNSIGMFGQWGDTFGALNALASTLAFVAVLHTISLQQKQIDASKSDGIRKDFDENFFRLLSILRENRNDVKLQMSADTPQGIPVFRKFAISLRHHIVVGIDANGFNRQQLEDVYRVHGHQRLETSLGPYFRIVYTILYRIDKSSTLSEAEKIQYANLLRSQFSSPEIDFIGLNGLISESKDISYYIKKYKILKYMESGSIRDYLEIIYGSDDFAARDD